MQTLFARKVRAGVVAGALALGLVAVATPMAQAQDKRMAATVPFPFESGGRHFDSGKYIVEEDGSIVTLKNQTTDRIGMVLTHADEAPSTSQQSKLVFHRIGDRYFLKQVWTKGSAQGRELPTSRSEKEALIAQAEPTRSNVIVALNRLPR